jgi:hypothetical protein
METKKGKISIELRSDEVQELMGKIPPVILRFGIAVILMILLLCSMASFYIKYPAYETVPVTLNIGENTRDVSMPFDGSIVGVKVDDGECVKTHDTLAVIANTTLADNSTTVLYSPSDGIVYACDFFRKGEIVEQGTPLLVVNQNDKGILTGKCYVSQPVRQKMMIGEEIECVGQEIILQGKIGKIAEVMNPKQKGYAVEIVFEDNLPQGSFDETFFAKFKTSDKTIFELFFLKSTLPKF